MSEVYRLQPPATIDWIGNEETGEAVAPYGSSLIANFSKRGVVGGRRGCLPNESRAGLR